MNSLRSTNKEITLPSLPHPSTMALMGAYNGATSEMIYAGKPLSYWLARFTDLNYEGADCEVTTSWMFRHFGDAAVPGLIESLRGFFSILAQIELYMIGSPAAVLALTEALKHEDPQIRTGASEALHGTALNKLHSRPELTAPLKEALPMLAEVVKTDRESQVVHSATSTLFRMAARIDATFPLPLKMADYENAGFWAHAVCEFPERFTPEEVVPVLVSQIGHKDASVRLEVARALSKFDPDYHEIVPIFVEHVVSRECIDAIKFSGLDRIVMKALPALRQALEKGCSTVRSSILHALAWSECPAAIPTLVEGFDDESSDVRSEAVSSLCFVDPPTAVPLLVRALQDKHRYVRREARGILKRHRHLALAVMPELMELLEKGEPIARASAALALEFHPKVAKQALPTLRRNLEHTDSYVRLTAAIAIAEVEPVDTEVLNIVSEGINHEEQDVRAAAINAIGRAGRKAIAVLPQLIEGSHHRWPWILAALGPDAAPAIPCLVEMMKDQGAGNDVLEVLGKIGPKVIPALVEAMQHGSLLVRCRAIRALGHMGPQAKQFVPPFIALLKGKDPVLRITAAEALGNIGPAAIAALPALKEASTDRDIGVHVHAKKAVSRIEGKASA